MKTKWITSYHLDVFNVDHRGRANFISYFNFMQESALKHAHHLGFGSSDLLEKNLLWVVTRFELHTFSEVEWDHDVIVETWSRGLIGPYAFRDFIIRKSNGEILGKASSSWIPIDVVNRKSVSLRPEDLDLSTSLLEEVGVEPRKILYRPNDEDKLMTFAVRYSDLDINRHVNNTKYIQWIYDSLSLEEIDKMQFKNFAINYNNEAKLGDTIALYRNENRFVAKNQRMDTIFTAEFC